MNYPLRECPYCDGMISNISRLGNILKPDKYANRTACSQCQPAAVQARLKKEMPVLDSPIDVFIYGRSA